MPFFKPGTFLAADYSGFVSTADKTKKRYKMKMTPGAKVSTFSTHHISTIHDKKPRMLLLWADSKLWHGCNTNYLTRQQLMKLLELVFNMKINKETYPLIKRINYVDIGNPREFYYSKLKNFLGDISKMDAYRTYIPLKLRNMREITVNDLLLWRKSHMKKQPGSALGKQRGIRQARKMRTYPTR